MIRDVLIMLLGVAIYALKTVQLCSNYATNFAILCFGYALNTAKLCFLMRLFLLQNVTKIMVFDKNAN